MLVANLRFAADALARERIGHVQLADNPGRNEPGTGEINYPFLFRHLDAIGYRGWIGCEYKPSGRTLDSLAWFAPFSANTAAASVEPTIEPIKSPCSQ